jgi:hypothetical protein
MKNSAKSLSFSAKLLLSFVFAAAIYIMLLSVNANAVDWNTAVSETSATGYTTDTTVDLGTNPTGIINVESGTLTVGGSVSSPTGNLVIILSPGADLIWNADVTGASPAGANAFLTIHQSAAGSGSTVSFGACEIQSSSTYPTVEIASGFDSVTFTGTQITNSGNNVNANALKTASSTTLSGVNFTTSSSGFTIYSTANLTVGNSSIITTTGSNSAIYHLGGSSTTLTINDGTVTATETAVLLSGGANFSMTGGSVSGKTGVKVTGASSVISISGGTITGLISSVDGAALDVDTCASVTVSGGGTIISNDDENPAIQINNGELNIMGSAQVTGIQLGVSVITGGGSESVDLNISESAEIEATGTQTGDTTLSRGVMFNGSANGTLEMSGGSVEGYVGIVANSGTVNLTGGTVTSSGVTGQADGFFAAVRLFNSIVTVDGATINGGAVSGVSLYYGGTLSVLSGSITGEKGIVAPGTNTSSVSVSGGAVTGSNAGVSVTGDNSTVSISGGTISGVPSGGGGSVGLSLNDVNTTNITGGTITSTASGGQAIYFYTDEASDVLNISGDTTISATGSLSAGIHLVSNGTVNITGGTISGGSYGLDNFYGTFTFSPTSTDITLKGGAGAVIKNITSTGAALHALSFNVSGTPAEGAAGNISSDGEGYSYIKLYGSEPSFVIRVINGELNGDTGHNMMEVHFEDVMWATPVPPSSQSIFRRWTAEGMILSDPTLERQDFTAPIGDVTLTAVFDLPVAGGDTENDSPSYVYNGREFTEEELARATKNGYDGGIIEEESKIPLDSFTTPLYTSFVARDYSVTLDINKRTKYADYETGILALEAAVRRNRLHGVYSVTVHIPEGTKFSQQFITRMSIIESTYGVIFDIVIIE